jgi:hypothetical protein
MYYEWIEKDESYREYERYRELTFGRVSFFPIILNSTFNFRVIIQKSNVIQISVL